MPEEQKPEARDIWLVLASEAFSQSTSFVDANYRTQWDNNIRHFQSRHMAGSKYNTDAYQYRSRLFRPKTRSAIRSNEAAAQAAFFANKDVVSIEPTDPDDKRQRASADINRELINYRLAHNIPWFLVCLGGVQEAMAIGTVVSYQCWKYREKIHRDKVPVMDQNDLPVKDEAGAVKYETLEKVEVLQDHPWVELLPVENIRIHPNSNWLDPINSSPYLIILWPMYVKDVKARMLDKPDSKTGQPKWKRLEDAEISSAMRHPYDSTRQARETNREDKTTPKGGSKAMSNFDVVWVHENFMDVDGEDYVYFTLGTEFMLSEPKPIKEVYFTGDRPVAMGLSVIEAHKIFPSALGQLGENIQQEINENINQRSDNVKLALNKRFFVRRGANVDLPSLVRNVAGSITMVGDVDRDVKEHQFNDVTASSYQEQDRLNLDFDELVGVFSGSTLQSNRRMNETVGGMSMLRGSSNVMTEYVLRTISETWIERVLKQLVKLEQKYESDEVILAIAAKRASLFQRYEIDEVTDDLLDQDLTTTVNVGMGATDPIRKLQNLILGLNTIVQMLATVPPNSIDVKETAAEIFGFLGYKDGDRFWVDSEGGDLTPREQQMQQLIQQMETMIQELQAAVQNEELQQKAALQLAQVKEQGQDRRKAADISAKLMMKKIDLQNPVAGENVNGRRGTEKVSGQD